MSITPQPGSGPPRRLTARERQELKEIETALVRSDPRLGTRLSRPGTGRAETQSTTDHVVQVVVVLVLCALVLPGSWTVALVVLSGVVAAVLVARRTVRDPDSGS